MLKGWWFQLHWLLGISAGAVLALVGVTGATLSFEEELITALNPDIVGVSPAGSAMTPPQLAIAAQALRPQNAIRMLTVYAEPEAAAKIMFAPADPKSRRGEVVYIDPYRGSETGTEAALRGHELLHFMEDLHRRLAAGDTGRAIVGTSTIMLIVLTLSGLYLRWPRRALDWRRWLRIDFALRGRSLLWNLHSVVGTWVLLLYLLAALTGLYFAYDWYRNAVYALAGETPRPRQTMNAPPRKAGPQNARVVVTAPDFDAAWARFALDSGAWRQASFNAPARPGAPVQITYLAADAPHGRAVSRMEVAGDGELREHRPYATQSAGAKLIASMFALHSGVFFGRVGQILMLLASTTMPLFFVTGWMLYLDRRRQQRAVAAARRAQTGDLAMPQAPPAAGDHEAIAAPWLVLHASQSGRAEALALRSAQALRAGGQAVELRPLADCDVALLARHRRALFVVSTFGDGEPPDHARRFAQRVMQQAAVLPQLRFAVLALGDRHYQNFCGFGHTLFAWLQRSDAQALFAPLEIDNDDPDALAVWQRHLQDCGAQAIEPLAAQARFRPWRLLAREHLNPGSVGAPTYWLRLAASDVPQPWQAGDIAEVQIPTRGGPLVREYSIASIPADGMLDLVIRQTRSGEQLGSGSGWLTAQAPLNGEIALHVRRNAAFHAPEGERPLLLIGNGTGIAGLRAHWRARIAQQHRRNWLIFGERHRAVDAYFADEIAAALHARTLARVDAVYSRDGGSRRYVQDVLRAEADAVRAWIADGAAVMVCGSLAGMAPAVDAALREVLGASVYEDFAASGLYRRDVY